MALLRVKMINSIVRKVSNLNSSSTSDPAGKLIKQQERYMNDNVPDNFKMKKCVTRRGSRYQIVIKKGEKKHKNAVLYLHGGAYVAGLMELYRRFAPDFYNAFEKKGGADIYYLDYSLAPEYKFPTQLNEACDMWRELTECKGYRPEDIFVLGDSAGAHLTITLLMKLRDEGLAMPRAAACISLWGDMTCSGESYRKNYRRDVIFGEKDKELTDEKLNKVFDTNLYAFIGEMDRKDPFISPVYGDFNGFPKMFMSVGGREMLLDDTMRVAKRLKAAKVRTTLVVEPDMFHIYPVYRDIVPEGRRTMSELVEFMRSVYCE